MLAIVKLILVRVRTGANTHRADTAKRVAVIYQLIDYWIEQYLDATWLHRASGRLRHDSGS